jgi:hypothetical protein
MPKPPHLPAFSVSPTMKAAASAVAASFHAYQQSCFDMPKVQGTDQMQPTLKAQRERKQAYHLALKFLSTATLKENPAYNAESTDLYSSEQATEIKPLFDRYLETRLNELIRSENSTNPLIRNTAEQHPVIAGPW